MKKLFITILVCIVAVTAFLSVPDLALGASRQDVLRRRITTLEQTIQSLNNMLDWLKDTACSVGIENYCPEPEPVVPPVYKARFTLKATAYNPLPNQTDATPCEGAWGNVCQSFDNGENPIAISRDLIGNPLWKGNKLVVEDVRGSFECSTYLGRTFTVMDTLGECTRANRDLRTGRCFKKITNQIDVFIPCPKEGDCEEVKQKTRNFGICQMTLSRI